MLRSIKGFPLTALLPSLPSDDLILFQASTPATPCEALRFLIPREQTQLLPTPKQRSADRKGRGLRLLGPWVYASSLGLSFLPERKAAPRLLILRPVSELGQEPGTALFYPRGQTHVAQETPASTLRRPHVLQKMRSKREIRLGLRREPGFEGREDRRRKSRGQRRRHSRQRAHADRYIHGTAVAHTSQAPLHVSQGALSI